MTLNPLRDNLFNRKVMRRLSSYSVLITAILLLAAVAGAEIPVQNPVYGSVDLSSNFCEHRPGHFHGGIDIRTGGKTGRKVYAPVDGYVWRIKYSFIGYGKGLYLKDGEGFIYVFGHLSKLSDRLEEIVRSYQYANQSYSFDNFYPPDSIPVSQGELIAYSGQTGYGAPHIHYEIRNPNNMPLNPLIGRFELEDKYPPQVAGMGIISTDSTMLQENGYRRFYPEFEYDRDNYTYFVRNPIVIAAPFGVSVKAFDRIRSQGPRLNIYRATYKVDDKMRYEVAYDKYDYAETREVDLSFDYPLLIENNKDWHLLYIPEGKRYDGSKSPVNGGGVFGLRGEEEYGLHQAEAEFFDPNGNSSKLKFRFVMLPPFPQYEPIWVNDSTCYLEVNYGIHKTDFVKAEIYEMHGRHQWKKYDPTQVEILSNGDLRVHVPTDDKRPGALKVEMHGESGWQNTGCYVVLDDSRTIDYQFAYEVIDGGIRFHVSSDIEASPPPEIDIVFNDGYTRKIKTIPYAINKFYAFYRAGVIRSPIIRFDLVSPDGDRILHSEPVNIMYGGNNALLTHEGNLNEFNVVFEGSDFYTPAWIELAKHRGGVSNRRDLVFPVYDARPRSLPLADYMTVSFGMGKKSDPRDAIYRLNDKEKWIWLGDDLKNGMLTAESRLLGTFAVLKDTEAPRINRLYPGKGKTVGSALPKIQCRVEDNLSGIGSDEQVTVLLDGSWVIPEYDPETGILQTSPRDRLKEGRHELAIRVADRAGNEKTVTSHFFVKFKK